jgi:hypothetical protein
MSLKAGSGVCIGNRHRSPVEERRRALLRASAHASGEVGSCPA